MTPPRPTPVPQVPVPQVDVRGPRFAAWVTTAVLVAVIVVTAVDTVGAAVLLGVQAVVFGIGAAFGPRRHPYGVVFARLVAPRLGPVTDREPVAPLRFAQLVGLVFAGAGTLALAVGATVVGLVFTAFALFAALLNAAFGICLGCQLYPIAVRLRHTASTPA
ncbi:DUF4395 domain-containing protein [Mycobacterium sp. WMMD1722]|uniref:DUF4395 domain-containing protein n=1 Tax=Mycobacterium sp. WMMD1722 TaxID=3404117 RepID=UPI003BF5F72B